MIPNDATITSYRVIKIKLNLGQPDYFIKRLIILLQQVRGKIGSKVVNAR